MMKNKQKISITQDLSDIDNLDDLEAKIKRTRTAIRLDERALREHFKEIPAEGIKSTFGHVVPFFAKTPAAENTWNIIQTIVSLLINNPQKKNFKGVFDKNYLQYSLKQIGIFVGVRLLKSYLQKRQAQKS